MERRYVNLPKILDEGVRKGIISLVIKTKKEVFKMLVTNQPGVVTLSPKDEKKKEYRGLCSTCKKAPTCTFPRDPNRPVLQCDEFEGYEYTPDKKTLPRTSSKAKLSALDEDSGKYKGLCRLCENRETCTYPKSEGGVWHCDEYC